MAKKRELTPAATKKLKERLLDQRLELVSSVSRMADGVVRTGGTDVSVDHMADAGSDVYEQDLNLGILANEAERLAKIDAALERLRDGVYGLCEGCGDPIGKARIDALPSARLCIDCKSFEEENVS